MLWKNNLAHGKQKHNSNKEVVDYIAQWTQLNDLGQNTHAYTHMHTRAYVCTCVCMCVYACVFMHTHACTHTHMYTYIHMCTHTQSYMAQGKSYTSW